ncbi:solute carrier family 46 member 3-like [Plakobranchus ocellatus]|uniref:Solute carrier family 46 member 3-like n=1 Tax=Plakobranchus ocellatus TaxID=259542 RepID=A0AAV4DLI0_9GAST|nr:solute carrier family 46 member 3-like [Plakobranchus ocellatus]
MSIVKHSMNGDKEPLVNDLTEGKDGKTNFAFEIESEPLLKPKKLEEDEVSQESDVEEDRRKKTNMLLMMLICSISMLGYGIFRSSYNQWIYVRFERDALGANFSFLNHSAAKDPCFREHESESPYKKELFQAQSNTARFYVWSMLCSLVPSLFTNLVLGAYSDQIGRRIIFIVPMAGNLIRTSLTCIVAYWGLNVYYILIGSVINGLCGDLAALFMAIFVYTADNTSKGKNRSFLMVFAQAISSMCYYLTQFASGYYIEAKGYVWPMWTGVGALLLSFILCILFIRETLDKSQVQKIGLLPAIKSIFSFYFEAPENPLYRRTDFILLGLAILAYGPSMGCNINTMFLMNEPFCWGSRHIGYVKSAFGLGNAILATGLMKLLQMIISDELVAVVSLSASVTNRFVLAFATNDWQIYTALAAAAFESPVLTIIRSILSKMIHPTKRGSLFASITVIETATIVVSGAGLNELYASTVAEWRGLTFFVIGCITSTAALLLISPPIPARCASGDVYASSRKSSLPFL